MQLNSSVFGQCELKGFSPLLALVKEVPMVRSWLMGAGLGVLINWKSRCQASRGFSIAQLCLYVEEWQIELR